MVEDRVSEVVYMDGTGAQRTLHNVRYVSENGSFLVVMHSDDAPNNMGWYDAQEHHGYEETRTQIPLANVVRLDGK